MNSPRPFQCRIQSRPNFPHAKGCPEQCQASGAGSRPKCPQPICERHFESKTPTTRLCDEFRPCAAANCNRRFLQNQRANRHKSRLKHNIRRSSKRRNGRTPRSKRCSERESLRALFRTLATPKERSVRHHQHCNTRQPWPWRLTQLISDVTCTPYAHSASAHTRALDQERLERARCI